MADQQVARWRDEAFDGEFLWAGGYAPALPPHHHATWQIGVVMRGALRFVVGSWESRVSALGLVVVPPRVPHSVSGEGEGKVEYAQVELPERMLPDEVARGWAERDCFVLTSREVTDAFLRLVRGSNAEVARAERLDALDVVLAEVGAVVTRPPKGTARDGLVEEVVSRLERTTDRPMPLAEITGVAGVSRSTLLRRFRREIGATPHHYHISVRLRAALELIEQGHSIAEASLRAGFHDQAHFTRHARMVLAMGPGKWRRRRRVQG